MEKIYGQFDIETIEKIADIVEEKELSEITLTDGDKSILCLYSLWEHQRQILLHRLQRALSLRVRLLWLVRSAGKW